MDDKISITFDDEFRLRVLDSDKYKQTESLDAECTAFVQKIQEFNTTVCDLTKMPKLFPFCLSQNNRNPCQVHSLVEVLDKQSKKIETEKLKVSLSCASSLLLLLLLLVLCAYSADVARRQLAKEIAWTVSLRRECVRKARSRAKLTKKWLN
jgi:hypothetical protein